MTKMFSEREARYLAICYGDMIRARRAAYDNADQFELEAYRTQLETLLAGQKMVGMEIITSAEIEQSVNWCNRMLGKVTEAR